MARLTCSNSFARGVRPFKQAEANGRFKLLELGVTSQRDLIIFNQNTGTNPSGQPHVNPVKLKWFRNTKFRQAVSFAIDRPSIVQSTLGGRGEPNYGFITSSNERWINTEHRAVSLQSRARETTARGNRHHAIATTMACSKMPRATSIEFEMNTNAGNSRREKGSIIVQDDLKKLGMRVNFRPLEFNLIVQKFTTTFDFECIFLGPRQRVR